MFLYKVDAKVVHLWVDVIKKRKSNEGITNKKNKQRKITELSKIEEASLKRSTKYTENFNTLVLKCFSFLNTDEKYKLRAISKFYYNNVPSLTVDIKYSNVIKNFIYASYFQNISDFSSHNIDVQNLNNAIEHETDEYGDTYTTIEKTNDQITTLINIAPFIYTCSSMSLSSNNPSVSMSSNVELVFFSGIFENLKSLSIDNIQFKNGTLYNIISKMNNVEELVITNTNIRDELANIIEECCTFKKIKKLHLNNCNLTTIQNIDESHLPDCEDINISNNPVIQKETLYCMEKIKRLDIHNTKNITIKSEYSELSYLEYLSINSTNMTDLNQTKLPSLKSFIISGKICKGNNIQMRPIVSNITNINNLKVSECNINTPYLDNISKINFSNIVKLNVSNNSINTINDVFLANIKKLNQLTHLNMDNNRVDKILASGRVNNNNVQYLSIANNNISYEHFTKISDCFPNLTHLDVSNNTNVFNTEKNKIKNVFNNLTNLTINSCFNNGNSYFDVIECFIPTNVSVLDISRNNIKFLNSNNDKCLLYIEKIIIRDTKLHINDIDLILSRYTDTLAELYVVMEHMQSDWDCVGALCSSYGVVVINNLVPLDTNDIF